MTRYKERIRDILQDMLDAGATRSDIANPLGIAPRLISMAMSPTDDYRLAVKHLPALQEIAKFTDREALQLVGLHTVEYEGCAFDNPVYKWIVRCTWRESRRAGASHASR
jgi:hypothetical protein